MKDPSIIPSDKTAARLAETIEKIKEHQRLARFLLDELLHII